MTTTETVQAKSAGSAPTPPRGRKRTTSLAAHGEPMVWLTGGSLALGLLMVFGLLALVLVRGVSTFWPSEVVRFVTSDGEVVVGEVGAVEVRELSEQQLDQLAARQGEAVAEAVRRNGGVTERRRVRSVDMEETAKNITAWYDDFWLATAPEGLAGAWDRAVTTPEWMLHVERYDEGRYFGEFVGFEDENGRVVDLEEAWSAFQAARPTTKELRSRFKKILEHDIGAISRETRSAKLDAAKAELNHGEGSPKHLAAVAEAERVASENVVLTEALYSEAAEIEEEGRQAAILVRNAEDEVESIAMWEVVRAFRANTIQGADAWALYADRWSEYLTANPRKANTEGGVYPAIFGTVLLTLLMVFAVVPFGVLAALYLREYAKQGVIVSTVRIAVNNLAGVPSIVFGVFGLGFFCYVIGGDIIDPLFFAHYGNEPVFGGGGILWASLTLALLTLPVVIVATEEALAAVPGSMREGSYACGATKWQTMRRIVLPRAMPGIMTGMILAVARGAGEVAPLMLVGAVQVAESLPLDSSGLHPERRFMHLGFHIYDLGFKSPDSEAAIPMVYTTTLLLITIVVVLNLAGIWVRTRLRKRFSAA